MARFRKDFIEEIKSRLKVSDVVGKYVKLTQRGSEFVGLSPFKNEKTPSFTVNDQKEFYHCFSTSEHGNIFDFLMKTKGLNFYEAIENLARQSGLDPEKGKSNDYTNREDEKIQKLRLILADANKFFINNFKKSLIPINYLEGRQVVKEVIQKFEIGYAGNSSDDLCNLLQGCGHKIEDIIALGLIKKDKNKENNYYDFFRNRLMFPIKNYKSQVIAFGGRALDNSKIKYINSSESPIFKKSFNLYGLDIATEEKKLVQDIYLVEGYMDVISLYQNGFKTSVAPLGTALTKFQVESLWRHCKIPTIIFDGDEAGQKAAMRAAMMSLSLLKPEYSLKFCILPKDIDPDDYLKNYSNTGLQKIIDKSLNLSDFIWQNEFENFKLSTPEEKAGFDKKIKQTVSQIQDETIAAYYKKDFNDRLSDLKKQKVTQSYNYKKYKNFSSASKETIMSDRADFKRPESIVREKIIIYIVLENSQILEKYMEELGNLKFNDIELSKICSKIVDFSSQSDKDLEKSSLKSYLEGIGFQKTIRSIYHPSLLDTYKSLIARDQLDLEKSFEELLKIQTGFFSDEDLNNAASELEKNMDEKSFENFVKLKKESLNKNILK